MPKAKPKTTPVRHCEIVVIGEVSPDRVLTAQLILLGINPVEAARRVRASRLEREAEKAA